MSSLTIDYSGSDTDGNEYQHIDEIWRIKGNTTPNHKRDESVLETKESPVKKRARPNDSTSTSTSTLSSDSCGTESKSNDDTSNHTSTSMDAQSSTSSSTTTSASLSTNPQWYQHGAQYWENIDATLDGVLGGFAHISPIDVQSSRTFLSRLPNISYDTAIDCGAGIGRVAKQLLCPLFQHVDLVEQNQAYVEKAKSWIQCTNMRYYYVQGLQDFNPAPNSYDVIWIQWVASHLTDDDLVSFLLRCKNGLKHNGYICLKENLSKKGFVYDCEDGSVTRSDALYKLQFARAGMSVVKEELQKGFPKGLFAVRMYALR